MHLGDVGFDIQSQISQFCSPEDLANLSTVHTSIRDAAEYVLYSHIHIGIWAPDLIVGKGTRKSPWALVEKKSLLHTLGSNSRKAATVKSLDINLASTGHHHPDKVLPLMVSKLAKVLKTMPNLVDFRIQCGLTSDPSVGRTINQVIRGGHFQLHTLYLEDYLDLEGIIADQAHLRLLGIHETSYNKPPWAKAKGLHQISLRRHGSPTIFVLDDWFNDSPRITMFPAFHDPDARQEYQKIATSPRGVNEFYRKGYDLCLCLLDISEKNINLLGEMMEAMAICMRIHYYSRWCYTTLKIIVYDTPIHKPWRFSNFVKSLPLFDCVCALDFYYPDFEEEVLRPLATDLHICLSKDLGRAWPSVVREIRLQNGRSSVRLKLNRQDNWVLGIGSHSFSDSDDESW